MVLYLFMILVCLLTFCSCGHSAASGPYPARPVEKKISLDDVELTVVEHPAGGEANGGYVLKFSRQGRDIYTGECAFRVHNPQTVAGVPGPDCRSLLAYCFSGGAHCCMSLVVVTGCGSKPALNVIDLAHSDAEVKFIDADNAGTKAIRVMDWQFAYYSVEGSELQLSFADSPGMYRLLVFDGGKWRADKAGEFRGYYENLLKVARHSAKSYARRNDAERAAGAAIRAAYYLSISGVPAEETARELKLLLPSTWRPGADKIAEDVRQAVSEFNPVEVIE